MVTNPEITVLMSVYNGEKYLREAIDSILNQTFADFEFIIINDGSVDSSVAIIESYNDPRIRLINNETNIGITKSLNNGIKLSRGKYVARMDADDISCPERFEIQLDYFYADPSLTLCSSRCRIIDEYRSLIGDTHPPDSNILLGWHSLAWRLLFFNIIPHASVIVKKKTLVEFGGYSVSAERAEDYDLWSRMSFTHKMILIPDVLILWRKHCLGVSHKYADKQWQTAFKTMHQAHQRLTGSSIPQDYSIYQHKLVHSRCRDIEPYTMEALKCLNQIHFSFIRHYKPDLDTQKEIRNTIQNVHRYIFRIASLQSFILSVRIALYFIRTHPIVFIQEGVRKGVRISHRLMSKTLNALKINGTKLSRGNAKSVD